MPTESGISDSNAMRLDHNFSWPDAMLAKQIFPPGEKIAI
jgi:hypothetical protein